MKPATYADAGVNIDAANRATEKIKELARSTFNARTLSEIGSFGGMFDGAFPNLRQPVLVASADGVGTKLKVAMATGVHSTVGGDLVNHCVNDILVQGAEPLFFLDYLALPKDDPDLIAKLVAGVSAGCEQSGCALLGGETAIMPDIYAPGDFDMAGFCVGVVERKRIIDGSRIKPGDVVIGLESSGLHSNGFSLVRKAVFERAGLAIERQVPELAQSLGTALLTPTRIYVKPILDVLEMKAGKPIIRGMAHITGGGIADNLERVLPEDCRVSIDRAAWDEPAVFAWLAKTGNIDREEMFRVFNMGIGFTVVVRPRASDVVRERLAGHDIRTWVLGTVEAGERAVTYLN